MNVEKRCEMYRRQLGGANAANNRKSAEISSLRCKVEDLRKQVDKLKKLNGELCAEVNAKDARIRELEAAL